MIKTAKTENGWVRGISAADPRIISYKGVPFAAPPVGDLRWRAPQPAQDWEGTLDCLEFAPISMQAKPGTDPDIIYTREWNVDPEISMSEDCLYLNIWTPAKTTDEKLPVFVWYFGGGLKEGNTAEMEFDGERIARRGVVVVTVNYRVNIFGFFAHPEITKEAPEAPANFGNLDQQYGLMWTKRNIAAFGGDPDNITIGGQSAGGGSVLSQLNCPANKEYIQKAVIMSGIVMLDDASSFRKKITLSEEEENGKAFIDFLGVKNLAEARALSADVILEKYIEHGSHWGTIIDGIFQTDMYKSNLEAGKLLDVPILLGNTNNEFLMRSSAKNLDELKQKAEELFGEDADTFLELIEADGDFETAIANSEVSIVDYSVHAACKLMESLGMKGPRYCYVFDPEMPGWDDPGSFHSSDLWFWFETLAKCWRPFVGKHYDLARQMCNYLTNFIANGDPNGNDADGTPMEKWETYTDESPFRMTLFDAPKGEANSQTEYMKLLLKHKLKQM